MRVGCYFARSVLWWFLAFGALAAAVLGAADTRLWSGERMPSVWALFAPVFSVAVFVAWSRARRCGEDVAAAAGGAGPRQLVPLLGLGVVLQFAMSWPGGYLPDTRGAGAIQRGMDGELFATGRVPVVLRRDGRVLVLAEGELPPGFQSMPHNPQRYRRQAFFLHAPRLRPANDLDPHLLRWCFALFALLVPTCLSRARDPRWWVCALLPAALPLLLL